jgi:(2Fe-2S) ferredoxin
MSDQGPLAIRTHVFCCTNVRPPGHPTGCCANGGSVQLREHMKRRVKALGLSGVRINTAGCLDQCRFGPVMVIYPEGVWYRYASRDDIEEIIRVHLLEGDRVERLLLKAAIEV